VDLVRFELATSSMPFKIFQSVTGVFTRNKRLSARGFGRRWTPQGVVWAFGLRADSRTPTWEWHLACFRAQLPAIVIVAGWRRQLYKGMPVVGYPVTNLTAARDLRVPLKSLQPSSSPSRECDRAI
jgi:hypothetical protein